MEPVEATGTELHLGWRTQWRRMRTLTTGDVVDLLKTTANNWYDHNVPRLGASVTFYTLLSLAPLLVIVVAVASFFFGREAAEGQLVWQIRDLIGDNGAETVQALLQGAQRTGGGLFASVLGFITLTYGATAAVAELRDALNTIWCVPKKQQSGLRGVLAVLLDRTVAFATVVGLGFLLLVSLTVNTVLSALGERYHLILPTTEFVLHLIELLVSFFVIALLFALIYKLLPDLPLTWRDVIPGAIVTALLFSAGKVAIGMYLGRATIASTYGAAGSLVILLLWVYYSAQIFFFGAEFTQAYAQTFGSRPCDRAARAARVIASPLARPQQAEPEKHHVQIVTSIDAPEPEEKKSPEIAIVISGKDLNPENQH